MNTTKLGASYSAWNQEHTPSLYSFPNTVTGAFSKKKSVFYLKQVQVLLEYQQNRIINFTYSMQVLYFVTRLSTKLKLCPLCTEKLLSFSYNRGKALYCHSSQSTTCSVFSFFASSLEVRIVIFKRDCLFSPRFPHWPY